MVENVLTTPEEFDEKSALESYATASQLDSTLQNYPTNARLNEKLQDFATVDTAKENLRGYAKLADVDLILGDFAKADEGNGKAQNFVTAEQVEKILELCSTAAQGNSMLAKSAPTIEIQSADGQTFATVTLDGKAQQNIMQFRNILLDIAIDSMILSAENRDEYIKNFSPTVIFDNSIFVDGTSRPKANLSVTVAGAARTRLSRD